MSLSKRVARAYKLYFSNFLPVFTISLAVYLPTIVLGLLINKIPGSGFASELANWALSLLRNILVFAPLAIAMAGSFMKLSREEKIQFGDFFSKISLKNYKAVLPFAAITQLLISAPDLCSKLCIMLMKNKSLGNVRNAFVLILFVLTVVLYIIAIYCLFFANYLYAADIEHRPQRAMRLSKEIMKGRFLKITGATLLISLAVGALLFVVADAFAPTFTADAFNSSDAFVNAGNIVFYAILFILLLPPINCLVADYAAQCIDEDIVFE